MGIVVAFGGQECFNVALPGSCPCLTCASPSAAAHIKAGGGEESGAKVTKLPPTSTLLSITSTDKDTTPL